MQGMSQHSKDDAGAGFQTWAPVLEALKKKSNDGLPVIRNSHFYKPHNSFLEVCNRSLGPDVGYDW